MMNTWFQDFVSNDICILALGARRVVFGNRAILATRAMSVGVGDCTDEGSGKNLQELGNTNGVHLHGTWPY